MTLVLPAAAAYWLPTPTVRVAGVSSGDVVTVYADAACVTPIGFGSASMTVIDIPIGALALGSHAMWAKRVDALGVSSPCSSSLLTYTVLPGYADEFPGTTLATAWRDGRDPLTYYSTSGSPHVDYQVIPNGAGRLEIRNSTNPAAFGYTATETAHDCDLTNASTSIELTVAPLDTDGHEAGIWIFADALNGWEICKCQNELLLVRWDAGGFNWNSIPYDPVAHRWIRLRHVTAGNLMEFETSPDGDTWTSRRSIVADYAVTSARIAIYGGGQGAIPASELDHFLTDGRRLP